MRLHKIANMLFVMPVLMTIVAILPGMVQACILENVNFDTTAENITVTWQTKGCDTNIKWMEVQWEHKKFLACSGLRKDDPSSRGVLDKLTVSKAVIRNLHPYSIYEVTIKATSKDRSTIKPINETVETRMTTPDTQAKPSNISRGAQKTIVFFYWEDPGNCERQNGQRDRYEVVLEGIDPWDIGKKDIEVASLPVASSYLAHKLKPFSKYQLTVFNRNFDPKTNQAFVNREDPLVIQVLPSFPGWRDFK